jgi:tetratricopeptide (TPR) repeat protein
LSNLLIIICLALTTIGSGTVLEPKGDYYRLENFLEARRYYHLENRLAPSDENLYRQALCCLGLDDYRTAVGILERIPRKDMLTYYYLGIAYYRLGMWDEAEINLRSAREFTGAFDPASYYLGLIALKRNEAADARDFFLELSLSPCRDSLLAYLDDYDRLIAARALFAEGRYADAIKTYEAIRDFFGYREIGLAIAYRKLKNYETGRTLLDSVLFTVADRALIERAWLESGLIDYSLKNFSGARAHLIRFLDRNPDPGVRFLIGLIFSQENKFDSAASYFQDLPDTVDDYLFHQGRTDYFRGRWGPAEEKLLRHREAFAQSPNADRADFILGSINFKRKEYRPAIEFWEELLQQFPGSSYAASAAKGIADAYFSIPDYGAALVAYRDIDRYKPPANVQAECRLKVYETRFYLKRYPTLLDALRAFLEDNPDSPLVPRTSLRIAKFLYDLKEYYASLAELDRLIEKYPDLPIVNEALVDRARIGERIGNPKLVKTTYQRMLVNKEAKEYYSFALNELGRIYSAESRFDSALIYYQPLLGFDKYREMTMLEIAQIYDHLGQTRETELVCDNLITEYPNSVFLYDASMLKIKALRRSGNFEKALADLQGLNEKIGLKAEIYVEIGSIYAEIQEYGPARDNYLMAVDLFRQDRDAAADALVRAGDASLALGERKIAREQYLRANLFAESLTLKNQISAKLANLDE